MYVILKKFIHQALFFFKIITFEKWTPNSTEKLIRVLYFMIHSTRFDHKCVSVSSKKVCMSFFILILIIRKKRTNKERETERENSLRKAPPPK